MVTEQSTGTAQSVHISGRHSITRPGATRSTHAAYIVQRETRRVLFANPAMPPRHAAPEWPTEDDNRDMAVSS